jgi:hypothetical protein
MEQQKLYLSPPQLARKWGTNVDKVLHFLNSGELVGVNLAKDANGPKKRWKIHILEIELFESRRSSAPPLPPQRKRRRKKSTSAREYF